MNRYYIYRIKYMVIVFAIAAFAAIVCITEKCSAYDDEVGFTVIDREMISVPNDIEWIDKTLDITDANGRKIKYELKDKRVTVYAGGKQIWQSNRKYFVQNMIIADVDTSQETRGNARKNNKSNDEIILLLWKEGRYGIHRPFWVIDDEKYYSQHIFTYNIEGEKVIAKWGSSYMGAEAKDMIFQDGILYLKHHDDSETAWQWISFGFEKVEPVRIFAAGDNLIHEPIYVDALNEHNGKFDFIYKRVRPYTRKSDISILNLETPLINDARKYSTYPCFGTPVSIADAIKRAGFNVVTLSTNHRFDKGAEGVDDTLNTLDETGLIHVGSMDDKPYILIKRNNIIFALMNYTYGTNGIRAPKGYENGVNYLDNETKVREDIREAKANSDFVMMFPHWGTEYKTEPDSYEIKWRDIFYEEGVDVVIGTHPHVTQKYEMYSAEDNDREMLIYYSLGNYISANQRREHNKGAYALFKVGLTSEGPKITSYEYIDIDSMYNHKKY